MPFMTPQKNCSSEDATVEEAAASAFASIPDLTISVVYASTSNYDEEEVEAFHMDLERLYREGHTFFKVIIEDFNAKNGPRGTSEERHIGTHGLEWSEQGERLSEFIMAAKTIHGNSQSQKPHRQRWTWESPNGEYHNEIDHIIVNRKFCLTEVAVVPKFYTGSDHRFLRARFYTWRKGKITCITCSPVDRRVTRAGTSKSSIFPYRGQE
uniref:Endo/exonuclease/phosphatase domain-containing protein n=1 Tax=Angiostrongylus cantonensis TaxID=6313 RepID=A0A0K0DE84_ANGCA